MSSNYTNTLHKNLSFSCIKGKIILKPKDGMSYLDHLKSHIINLKGKSKIIQIPQNTRIGNKIIKKSQHVLTKSGRISLILYSPTVVILGREASGKTHLLSKLTETQFNLNNTGFAHYRDMIVSFKEKLYCEISSYRMDHRTKNHFSKYYPTWNVNKAYYIIDNEITKLDLYNIARAQENINIEKIVVLIKKDDFKEICKRQCIANIRKEISFLTIKFNIVLYRDMDLIPRHVFINY